MSPTPPIFSFFFFNDTATTEIYTLSLHDALPISHGRDRNPCFLRIHATRSEALRRYSSGAYPFFAYRSEEHTSELQSRLHLVCRLLLEKKKKTQTLCHQYSFNTATDINEHHYAVT